MLPLYLTEYCNGLPAYEYDNREEYRYIMHEHAIIYHKLLFTLLLGKFVDVRKLEKSAFVRCIADVVALAQTYDVLPVVAEPNSRLLKQHPLIWEAFADYHTGIFFLGLAIKLKDDELYWESMRHSAAQVCHACADGDFPEMIEVIENAAEHDYPTWDIRETLIKHRQSIAEVGVHALNEVRSELLSSRYKPNQGEKAALFLGTAAPRTSWHAGTFLAQALIGEWLNNELIKIYNEGRSCPTCASIQSLP